MSPELHSYSSFNHFSLGCLSHLHGFEDHPQGKGFQMQMGALLSLLSLVCHPWLPVRFTLSMSQIRFALSVKPVTLPDFLLLLFSPLDRFPNCYSWNHTFILNFFMHLIYHHYGHQTLWVHCLERSALFIPFPQLIFSHVINTSHLDYSSNKDNSSVTWETFLPFL